MNTKSFRSFHTRPTHFFERRSPWVGIMCLVAWLGTSTVLAQAPGLLWSTNVGARLFAVDTESNAYATVGGSVVKISSAGVLLASNSICPLPGNAQRDAAGNFYFAGSFDGTQNFGGITLVGGCTNCAGGKYGPGWPSGFFAKYDSAGFLLNVVRFGPNAFNNQVTDLLVDSDGACYVGFTASGQGTVARFESSGTQLWSQALDAFPGSSWAVRLGGPTSSNFTFLLFRNDEIRVGRINPGGSWSFVDSPPDILRRRSLVATNGKPVIDDLAQTFAAGCKPASVDPQCSIQYLRKYSASELWTKPLTDDGHWVLERDGQANAYLAGEKGSLLKYDADGEFVWSNNFGHQTVSMVVDASGNRFVSFTNGAVARLASDPPAVSPSIVIHPQPQTVFWGGTFTLSTTPAGSPPFKYFWRRDGTNVPDAINASYAVSNATLSHAGVYTVVVTNAGGAITSAPALVRVKRVQIFLGAQMLTNGNYEFLSPPTLSIQTSFTNGSSFYTLDGSTPSFAATPYSGPFAVSNSATVRAIGYRADFLESEEADAVNIVLPPMFSLAASAPGGGSVSLNPAGGSYLSNTTVTATATPNAGWSFLHWLGDAAGGSASVNVTMNANKSIQAVFGTTLSTTVAGNGQVVRNPPGSVYPYGSTVRLTGLPASGNFFGSWGNAASGVVNPLYFVVTNPTPTVSSIFGSTPAGQSALTVLITGRGRVNASPQANVYATNQSVTLTATPDAGETFLQWSSDASGTANPLILNMNQSRVVVANFTGPFALRADGLLPAGFQITVVGDPFAAYQVFGSTNLSNWTPIGTVSNSSIGAEAQFTDPGGANTPRKFYKATR